MRQLGWLQRWGAAARKGPCVVLAAVCLAGGAVPSHALSGKGDYIGVWSASAAVGYAIPNTDEFGNTAAWRVAAGYSPRPEYEVGLEVGRFSAGVSQPEPGGIPNHALASGRLAVLPVNLTLHYRIPAPELLSTFALMAGVGRYFIDYTMGSEQRAIFVAGGQEGLPDQKVEDAWGFHLGGGVEYILTERVSLLGEGRYVFLAPRVRGTAASERRLEGSLDLNTWLFYGGLKFAF